jgi:hypothetical protein|tara:strand:- start:1402 stop:2184 length:783 start_codon:yes stop_codon:yes gene_type:complete
MNDKPLSANRNITPNYDAHQMLVKFTTKSSSGLLREYLSSNTGLVVKIYGRIGGLLRMTSDNANLSTMVKDWDQTNINIAKKQLSDLSVQLDVVELTESEEGLVDFAVEREEPLEIDWMVNHPIFRNVISVISDTDALILRAEHLYFKGTIDDVQFRGFQSQAFNVISGILDRVRKATSPGKRKTEKGDRYTPTELAKHIRTGGYKLEFFDLPSNLRKMSEEYNKRHSTMKSLIEERNKAKLKLKKEATNVAQKNDGAEA